MAFDKKFLTKSLIQGMVARHMLVHRRLVGDGVRLAKGIIVAYFAVGRTDGSEEEVAWYLEGSWSLHLLAVQKPVFFNEFHAPQVGEYW